jgi:hydroxymethylpyrimidine pyrophosphatase-like HAD family hydrolase
MGFSATSASAVEAILMLKKGGFLPVFNSGRSFQEVKSRCDAFGIPFGIAEHGSVIWNGVHKERVIMASEKQRMQRGKLLEEMRKEKTIIIDKGFVCGLRAFYRKGGHACPVPEACLQEYFNRLGISELRVIQAPGKSDIGFTGINKGTAIETFVKYLGIKSMPIYGIGDSISDWPVLERSDIGYAPSNLSEDLKNKIGNRENCLIAPYPLQRGFLWAAKDLLRRHSIRVRNYSIPSDKLCFMISQHEKLERIKHQFHFLRWIWRKRVHLNQKRNWSSR